MNWSDFSAYVKSQLADSESNPHTEVLQPGDYEFVGGDRVVSLIHKFGKPLHPSKRLLYETILQLNPASIAEVGVGPGDNLYNLATLYQSAGRPIPTLAGCDISPEMLQLVRERHPDMACDLWQCDLTVPNIMADRPKVDLVFSHTVLMHMGHDHDPNAAAIGNAFSLSNKYAVLMDNWCSIDFWDHICELAENGCIWADSSLGGVLLYYRPCPELNNAPHLMVASNVPLDYTPLTDYMLLLKPVLDRHGCDEEQIMRVKYNYYN